MNIFITGATGFLGGELLVSLSKNDRIQRIYCLIRAADDADATRRLESVFAVHNDPLDRTKVVAIAGDLAADRPIEPLRYMTDVDIVIHTAADTSFAPHRTGNIHRVNVAGAAHVARWAAALPDLKTFVYVGTSWICGCDRPGRVIREDESPDPAYNQIVDYTRSKSAGEIHIRNIIPADKLLVVRPSTIMGDSRPCIPRSFVISWVIAAFNTLRLITLNPKASCDIIPIDYAAQSIQALLFRDDRQFGTYHISAGTSATNLDLLLHAIGIDDTDRPSFRFVDYGMMAPLRLFAAGHRTNLSGLAEVSEYLNYWNRILPHPGTLENLLWAVDFYCRFANLDFVFDNTRLLQDTAMGLPEPAHVYMGRNRHHLKQIHIIDGSLDP